MELAAELQSLVDDDENHERQPLVPHRTVDEILLLYDSSSSAGSPSPPASPSHSLSPVSSSNNGPSIRYHDGSPSLSTNHFSYLDLVDDNDNTDVSNAVHNNISSHTVSLSSRNSLDSSASPTPKPLSNPHSLDSAFFHSSTRLSSSNLSSARTLQSPIPASLSPLFTATKSNAKPGAALAAAAAASRSFPTRNAAAIKSSRFTTPSVAPVLVSSVSSNSSPSAYSTDAGTEGCNDELKQETGAAEEADSERQLSDPQHFDNMFMEQNLRSLAVQSVEVDDNNPAGGVASPVAVATLHSDLSTKHLDIDESSTAASIVSDDSQVKHSQSPSPSESHDREDDIDEIPSFNTANRVVQEFLDTEKEKSVLIGEMHGQEHGIFHQPNGDSSENIEDDNADVAQSSYEQQNTNEDTKSTDKKSNQISLSPLEVAEELEKKQAFAGLHLEEGAAAQPMRLEGVRRVSTMLGYFDINSSNTITQTISKPDFTREHGYPVVLAVHVLYIAIGMSKGTILVLPSKYSPHNSDSMDAKKSKQLQGDRLYGPVTSLCFSQQGDFLFSGYGDGHCAVWDVQKASSVIAIQEHKAPVVHMLYLGQDSQVSKQFNVVTGDSKGVVKLIRFSFISFYKSSRSTVLCDEKMGVVICASSLVSSEAIGGELMTSQVGNLGTSSNWSMIGGATSSRYSPAAEDGVFIFVFHQYALVAKYVPSADNVVKYAHIPKPDGVGEGLMPYVSWRSVFDSNDSSTKTASAETSEKAAYLAIAWDRTVQVHKLVKSELKFYAQWTMDCSAVGLAWLDDQVLVILTSVGKLEMFTKGGTMIHETSFSVDISRGDDLITCHTFFNDSYGNPEKAYHNCVAVRGASIYVLGPSHLVICRLLPWKERVEDLRRGGDWIGALNMAMVLYDGQAHGAIDLPRTLEEIRMAIMPDLVKLVLSYVDEVFSYIKIASGNQVGNSDQLNKSFNSSSDHPEVKEQYIRVGGVAVEFCVHIKRTDILFDEIYAKFGAAQHKETFLELLEPYILKDMLGCLPPEVMQALVEHYSTKGWLQRVEQCVLHMDISSLDFNQVVRLCREHGLHGALIYLFNKGLEDFRTPLEELLGVLQNCESGSASTLGYRILVYLKYCFQGLAFPPGHGTLPTTRLLSIKEQILQFLLDVSNNPKSNADTNLPSHSKLPNLCHLLQLDTLATLNVLRIAFVDVSINSKVESTEVKVLGSESQNLVQKLVDTLCIILETSYFQRDYSSDNHYSCSIETWPSKEDAGFLFEFIAYYVAYEGAKVFRNTLSQILEYLTSVCSHSPGESENVLGTMRTREKQLLALLDAVPDTDWDALHLLFLCEKCQFHQVCGFIHSRRHQYVDALDSYIKAADEPIHTFSFIHDMLRLLSQKEFDSFQAAVISRIVDLVKLDREGAFFVVIHHFNGQSQTLFSELQSHPESFFLYMKTLIEVQTTGSVQFSRLMNDGSLYYPHGTIARHQSDRVKLFLEALSEFPKLLRSNPIQLTDEMTELYFELLCRYERESVLKFLETFESYRVEKCLHLCQEYGIVDAAAFLLERVGDVGNALSLILSGLGEKFIILESSMGSTQSDPVSLNIGTVLKEKEVRDILDIVHSCTGLCQRNSPRLGSHESEFLWFQLLDSFCLPLTNSREPRPQVLDTLTQEDEKTYKTKQKKSNSQKSSHMLRKLRSVFIREIVEAMIGHVDISTIMLKLLSDNRIQEFGDIKPTILGMLGTYDFERRILDTAKSLIEDDTYYTMNLLKKEASHGYAPQDLACCICNCSLAKNSSIQVFSCSHAIHVHCAGVVSSGCPICVAARNTQRSSKGVVDNGLVSKASYTQQKAPGTSSLHTPLDSDVFENSYSHHPVSRFELLNSLHKNERSIQIENMPSLRLAPPAVYHEKVKKGVDLMAVNSSSKAESSSRSRQMVDTKVKGSTSRFKLKSTIFGKERSSKRLQ